MKITEFNKPAAELIGEEAMAELKKLAEKHGLTVTRGNGTYLEDHLSFKVTFNTPIKLSAMSSDELSVKNGWIPRGSEVLTKKDKREVVIVKVLRVKYIYYYKDDPMKKEWVNRFDAFIPKETAKV